MPARSRHCENAKRLSQEPARMSMTRIHERWILAKNLTVTAG